MAKVKGTALKSTVDFFKKNLGAMDYAKLIEEMPPDEASILKNPILVSNWYEFSILKNIMKRAQGKVTLPSGRSFAWELGRHTAESSLKTIYKLFIKLADDKYVAKKMCLLFNNVYDSGRMELVTLEKNRVVYRVVDFDEPSVEFCGRYQGWCQRAIELMGKKNVVVCHPICKAKGDEYCEYEGKWD